MRITNETPLPKTGESGPEYLKHELFSGLWLCSSESVKMYCKLSGSCNPSTSFWCDSYGDFPCIPLQYRCDGLPDCRSEQDEINCANTCQEWWDAGYRESGMFKICKYMSIAMIMLKRKHCRYCCNTRAYENNVIIDFLKMVLVRSCGVSRMVAKCL